MEEVTVTVTGADELVNALKTITGEALLKAERKALRVGAKLFQSAIEERAPVLEVHTAGSNALPPGALKSDIVIKARKDDQGNPTCIIGPASKTSHVARWVEYGHRLVRGGKSRVTRSGLLRGPGKAVGMVPAHPFIRPAFEVTNQEAGKSASEALAVEIVKAVNRKTRKR